MSDEQRKIDEAYGVPHVDKAYVDALARPLVRFTSEPPYDALTVLAAALQSSLYEAWDMVSIGEIGLRQADERKARGEPGSLAFEMHCRALIHTGTKVIWAVADSLRLFRPGPSATPGERILAVRSSLGMTVTELARLAYTTRSHLTKVERGRYRLTPAIADGVARALNVTAEYLLTGENPPKKPTKPTRKAHP